MISKVISILWLFFLLNSIIYVTIIILERRKPERTIAWLLIFMIFPPIGMILYTFLGWNWKKYKLSSGDVINKKLLEITPNIKEYSIYHGLINLVRSSSKFELFQNNEIYFFNNGEEKFKRLKEELEKAAHHIHLEYYIVRDDTIGNEIKDILIKKASDGVKVRFIIDKVGAAKIKKKYIDDLKNAGIEIRFYTYFLAPIFKVVNTQINFRNHRKIVVIDGKVGFMGGMNIGDEYLGKGRLGYWRDTHMMIEGDAVKALQCIFLDDFKVVKKSFGEECGKYERDIYENLEKYFPINNIGNRCMQIIQSGPNSRIPTIMYSVVEMINSAQNHINIITPYFIPSDSVLTALKMAAIRGIDIKIIFPGKYDHFHVYYASRTYLKELAEEGVKVFFYEKNSFIHSKIITVDSNICSLGTANMDIRSYELNYEVNSIIYNKEKTIELEKQFYLDLKKSRLITIKDFEESSALIKVVEAFTRLFSNIL